MLGVDVAIARNVEEFVLVTRYRQEIERLKIKVDRLTERVSSLSATVNALMETIASQRRRIWGLLPLVCRLERERSGHGDGDDDDQWAPLSGSLRPPLRAPAHLSGP